MKNRMMLICVFPVLLFLTGCEISVSDDGHTSSVYIRLDDSGEGDLHTLYGSLEITDQDGFPLSDSRVQVEVIGDGRVQDSFSVVTGPEGLVRFEISVVDFFRPYDDLVFSIRSPGTAGLDDRIPIDQTAQIPDEFGNSVFLYEADAVLILPPSLNEGVGSLPEDQIHCLLSGTVWAFGVSCGSPYAMRMRIPTIAPMITRLEPPWLMKGNGSPFVGILPVTTPTLIAA